MEGARFYDQQEEGLGAYFIDSLSTDIDSLQLYAGIHEQHGSYHRLLAKRFPYSIYYRTSKDKVLVCAILYNRQDPYRSNNRLT